MLLNEIGYRRRRCTDDFLDTLRTDSNRFAIFLAVAKNTTFNGWFFGHLSPSIPLKIHNSFDRLQKKQHLSPVILNKTLIFLDTLWQISIFRFVTCWINMLFINSPDNQSGSRLVILIDKFHHIIQFKPNRRTGLNLPFTGIIPADTRDLTSLSHAIDEW